MATAPNVIAAGPIELRRWSTDALDELMNAIERSHAELATWMPWANPLPTRDEELAAVTSGMRDFDDGIAFHYFLFGVESGELVGGASLLPTEDENVMQIGYWVRSDRTGCGYASAAASALTTLALRDLHLSAVEIRMDCGNLASAAIPPKLGYVLAREETREIIAPGHTGKGFIWRLEA